jgi:cytochrome c oxidase assembly protein subunit 15
MAAPRASSASPDRSRPVAVWLLIVALLVFAMVVVGGATRLTGSGLSITQWRPIAGVVPPMSQAQWQADFALYRATPQFRWVNSGMTLEAFKVIFWWEWAHRLLGRLVGAAFAIPLAIFLALRRLPGRLVWRCAGLLGLGGLQGLAGWWMVKSGLEARVSVAPERLATHLGLAILLLAGLIWTGLEAWFGPAEGRRGDRWTWAALWLAGGVFVQCLLGALVAGNNAGLIDNDWPLMGGAWLPAGYWQGDIWRSLVHGQAAVQFNHRLLAYLVLALSIGMAVAAARSGRAPQPLRGLAFGVGAVACVQVALGIAALMTGAPLGLAILHQACACALLGLAVCTAWRACRL